MEGSGHPGSRPGRRGGAAALLSALFVAAVAGCGSDGGGGGGAAAPTATPGLPTPTPTDSLATPRGFVLTSFRFVFPTHDGDPCPQGLNQGPAQMRQDGGQAFPDDCADPLANVDPSFKTLDAPGVLDGFDLDGVASSSTSPGADECAHDDFSSPSGEPGNDFQLWRAIGCIPGFQEGEIVEGVLTNAVQDGSMTMLVEVEGVDDPRNDDSVSVRIFASTDTPPKGADGSVLPYGTLSAHPDPRYHSAPLSAPLVDGVVTIGPVDIRLRLNIQIVNAELFLRDAFLALELAEDGTLKGKLSGFWGVEDVYEIFGRQAGPPGRDALQYTCSGLYAALEREADGGFDPATQTCSSLSVLYRFDAVPAFVAK